MASAAVLTGSLYALPGTASASEPTAADIAQGKALAFNRSEGNCLACHAIKGGNMPGDIGPPLVAMKARFPDREKLFAQIWDPRHNNPQTAMPPFGANHILTKEQINKIVDFLYTL
ncbi:sulfur oxidation c-type cytochrome SoxX [Acidihalobacter prosperus]|uniref:Sulfur oxidation c-type cytochrome SoxX n=2 Tax=Acidihalobacter prosperus TaxID=160660 RepID=A0A1A6C6K0_9GAMM|nr:sulfur oxidation c-type cytochrome SoxX [Acidihalobacter prosperus]